MLCGRMTADPEIKTSASGSKYAKFSVAVNEYKKKAGTEEFESIVHFFDCTAFGYLAERIENKGTKGRYFSMVGKLQQSRYEKDGEKRSSIGIVVSAIEFPDTKDENAAPAQNVDPVYGVPNMASEDIPF